MALVAKIIICSCGAAIKRDSPYLCHIEVLQFGCERCKKLKAMRKPIIGERCETIYQYAEDEWYLIVEDRPSVTTGWRAIFGQEDQVTKRYSMDQPRKYRRNEVASFLKRYITDASEYRKYLNRLRIC